MKSKLFFMLLLFQPMVIFSQHCIVGNVETQTKEPMEFAEIIVQTLDSTTVNFVLTNENGNFSMCGINQGEYNLLIKYFSNIIYSKKIILNEDLDLETITTNAFIFLDEFEVKAKLNIKKEVGGKYVVTDINASPESKNKNSIDFLSTIPIINKSEDGKSIKLKNRKDVTFLLNGKEIGESEVALNILKSIPAEDIKKIEILTNPDSKYEAGKKNGIINITIKKQDDGWKGGVFLNDEQSFYNSQSANASLSYSKKNWFLTTGLYFDNYRSIFKDNTIYKDYINEKQTEIDAKYAYKTLTFTPFINVNYDINSKQSIGFQFNSSFVNSETTTTSTNAYQLLSSPDIDSTNQSIICNKTPNSNRFFFNTGYSLKTDTLGSNFDINFYTYYRENKSKINNDFYWVNDFQSILQQPEVTANVYKVIANHTQNFKNDDVLASGISYNGGIIHNDFFYGNYNGSEYISDTTRSNSFIYKDHTLAAFASYQKYFGDSWETQIGIRWEYYSGEGKSDIAATTHQKNNHFFPSLSVLFYANDDNEFSLDYRYGINRPSYLYYNPNVYYTSPYSYKKYNPNLLPTLFHEIAFNYSFFENYSLDVEYGYGKDLFNNFDMVQPNGLIATITDNYGKEHSVWVDFTYMNQFFNGRWRFSTILSYYFDKCIGTYNNVDLGFVSHSWGIDVNNYIYLNKKKTTAFNIKYGYLSDDKSIVGDMKGNHSLAVEFYTSYKNFNFSIRGYNLVQTKMFFKKETNEYSFYKTRKTYETVCFNINYTFGNRKVKTIYSKQDKIKERID